MSAHKNIWMFHHYADPPDGFWTGSFDLYKFLVKKGHRVTIISSSFNHYSRREERLKSGEKFREQVVDGVKFVFVRTAPYHGNNWRRALNMISYGVRAYRWGMAQKERPDVVIATTPHPFCIYAALKLSEKMKVPFLMELHDLWLDYILDTKMLSRSNPVYKLLERMEVQCYRKAEKVLVLWPQMDRYLNQFGVPPENIVWTPLGVDFSASTPPSPKAIHNGDPFVVMCTARFGPASNVDEILQAARILRERGQENKFRFVLIGGGPKKESLEQYVLEHQLTNIEFRGMIPKGDIPKHLLEADLCIAGLPDIPNYRKYGTIPTKVIDYLFSNRPTVFITSIQNSLVERANSGFVVPPKRPDILADTLQKAINLSQEERIRLGQNGVEHLRKNHNLEKLADAIEGILP